MRPLNKNVLVQYLEPSKVTESGIILKSSDEAAKGKVIDVGNLVTEVTQGDLIILQWTKAIKVDDDLYIINEDFITGVLE